MRSISVEDTFDHDVLLAETEPMIRRLAEKLWPASRKKSRIAHTVVLKLKTSEFKILTRSHTPGSPPSSYEPAVLTGTASIVTAQASCYTGNAATVVGVPNPTVYPC